MRLTPAIAALRPRLLEGLAALDMPRDQERVERWLGYLELLVQWNQTYNLTAIREPARMLSLHLLDSLALAPHWIESDLADLGSGAGLPGLPLSILHPDRHVTLIEANGKKCRFLREVKRALGLAALEIAEMRAEVFRPVVPFSAATARAVAPIAELAGMCRKWLKPGGRLLAMKGPDHARELVSIPSGFALVAVHWLTVPGLDAQRALIELRRD